MENHIIEKENFVIDSIINNDTIIEQDLGEKMALQRELNKTKDKLDDISSNFGYLSLELYSKNPDFLKLFAKNPQIVELISDFQDLEKKKKQLQYRLDTLN